MNSSVLYHHADICDEHFDLKRLHLCTLLIELDMHRITYAVLDQRNGKIVLLKEIAAEPSDNAAETLINCINNDAILKARYSKILLSAVCNKYTLVPSAFYDDDKSEGLFLFGNTLDEGENLKTVALKMPLASLIYSAPDVFDALSVKCFDDAQLFAHVAILVQACMQRFRYKQHPVMVVHIRNGSYDLVLINESKLKLVNTFQYVSNDDFIYYLLFACEQLGLNPETVETFLSGEVVDDSDEATAIRKYFSKCAFIPRTLNHGFAPVFDEIQAHRFTTLFDLSLCES